MQPQTVICFTKYLVQTSNLAAQVWIPQIRKKPNPKQKQKIFRLPGTPNKLQVFYSIFSTIGQSTGYIWSMCSEKLKILLRYLGWRAKKHYSCQDPEYSHFISSQSSEVEPYILKEIQQFSAFPHWCSSGKFSWDSLVNQI